MLLAISYLILLAATLYAAFILYSGITWAKIPRSKPEDKKHVNHDINVLIPVKNEDSTISSCIDSVLKNTLTPNKVTVINDGSTDRSVANARNSLRPEDDIISTTLDLQGKKPAIDLGVRSSPSEYLLTTDADCKVSKQWISGMMSDLGSGNYQLILGPVFIDNPHGLIQHFQQFDLIATMAISKIGNYKKWFYSGSAASMAYRRKTYIKLNPYTDNYHIRSGDDIFFIESILSNGDSINFIKNPEVYVLTSAVTNWNDLWKQRLRWAHKSKHYSIKQLKYFWLFISVVLLAYCLSGLLLLDKSKWVLFITLWIVKGIVDYLLIIRVVRYYKLKFHLGYFITSLFIYPFFTLGVGIRSMFYNAKNW